MDRYEFIKDNEKYSTSRSRKIKYYFEKINTILTMGESDDYFYFTLMKTDENALEHQFSLEIDRNNILFQPLMIILEQLQAIEVMEDGTPEQKSIEFRRCEEGIQLIFNLKTNENLFKTIEFSNLRRLGDTKFKKIIPSKNKEEINDILFLTRLKYEFKERLHSCLDEIEKTISLNLEKE